MTTTLDSQKGSGELAAVEVHGITRSSFILRGALTAGAALGAGAVAPFVSTALAADATTDLDILNFALTLEYLEANFYNVKAKTVNLSGDAKTLAASFGAEETAHVDALTAAINAGGGKPVAMPTFDFPVTDQASFLKLAYTLENVGVGAYNGAGPVSREQGTTGRCRLDRSGRGTSRSSDRSAHRAVRCAQRRLRQAADEDASARSSGAADQVKAPAW
jgi:hypothetical protein